MGFALNLFDIVGINQEDRSDNLIVLTPSDHMLVPDFPGLPQDGCTVTFDRDRALSREDAQFVSWEHPIIRNGLDLILSGDTGSCAVSLLKNKALPVGTLLVELVYVVEAQAPKHLQLTRFLPPTPIRMLMDRKGTNLAAQVEFESFNRQLNAVNRHTSSKLVNAVQQDVHAMLQQAESLVEAQARTLIEQAKQEADDKLSAELARLEALKAVNPNIRDDEVEALEFNRRQVLANLMKPAGVWTPFVWWWSPTSNRRDAGRQAPPRSALIAEPRWNPTIPRRTRCTSCIRMNTSWWSTSPAACCRCPAARRKTKTA